MNPTSGTINVQKEISAAVTVHKNLGQEVMVTTEDKVRLCLIEHRQSLRAKNKWTVPLGIFATLVVALCAADFRQFIVSADVWKALFILSTVVTFIWLARSGYHAYVHRKGGDIDEIVLALKAQQLSQDG